MFWACPNGSGFTLQVLALPIKIGRAVGFPLQSLTHLLSKNLLKTNIFYSFIAIFKVQFKLMHTIKVRGFHCDMFGHVNNARYLEFLEEARWEWLNRMGDFKYFEKKNLSFVVVNININYKRPSVLNDELLVTVVLKTIGTKSAVVHQDITRLSDNKIVADADVTFAMVDNKTGKAVELDKEIRGKLTIPTDDLTGFGNL